MHTGLLDAALNSLTHQIPKSNGNIRVRLVHYCLCLAIRSKPSSILIMARDCIYSQAVRCMEAQIRQVALWWHLRCYSTKKYSVKETVTPDTSWSHPLTHILPFLCSFFLSQYFSFFFSHSLKVLMSPFFTYSSQAPSLDLPAYFLSIHQPIAYSPCIGSFFFQGEGQRFLNYQAVQALQQHCFNLFRKQPMLNYRLIA